MIAFIKAESGTVTVRRIIYAILLSLLLVDIGYSFCQHMHQPLDGDMAGGIVPDNDVKKILKDPFGFQTISNNQIHANPNRFFSHWMFREYFLNAPIFLQKIASPIDSIYLSCALSKTIIQIMLIILLAMAISGTKNVLKLDFMIAAILVTPLFQTNGYRTYMGIIDPATTYTFFYALPSALLLLYLLPFIRQFYHEKEAAWSSLISILWIPLTVIVCLSGPLNPGIILIFSALVFMANMKKHYVNLSKPGILKRIVRAITIISKNYWLVLLPVSLLSMYSLFLGRYNSITIANRVPLSEIYSRIPEGIYYQLTQKLGFFVLFLILAINIVIIKKKFKTDEGRKIITIFKWIGIFSVCYILLLPLGGYRTYRPNILRYDTIMPITLSLMFIFGASSLFLIKIMRRKQRIWYLLLIAGVLFIFTNADEPHFNNNQCERSALHEIAKSHDTTVQLQNDCTLLSWGKIKRPEDSELNAQLLKIWGITKEKKLYYNK